ncbi:hypothetical protein FUAX_07220 [Fulvitalea axinellae]|uniref:FecR family protein n=1 Tax=Fulvitalea axinellae TaxID=1182444 RepID=A0AAU9DBU8_9BACT|nr:hypothetical protein FUAX_07220 [Fulvitalea axinellae]
MEKNSEDIENLLPKYLRGETSPEENALIDRCRESDPDMRERWDEASGIWESLNGDKVADRPGNRKQELLRDTLKSISAKENSKPKKRFPLAIAASLALLLAAGVSVWLTSDSGNDLATAEPNDVVFSFPETSPISLNEIRNGDRSVYDDSDSLVRLDALKKIKTSEAVTIRVPYGKRIRVRLEDGTTVWINSGTTLTVPEQAETGPRRVKVRGEAFFSVAHAGRPFVVDAGLALIKVYGTEFNVNNYPESEASSVTLVEGSVALFSESIADSVLLAPEQRAVLTSRNGYKVDNVKTEAFTSWKDNILFFENQSFKQLTPILERWYGVSISDPDNRMEGARFTGIFDETDSLEIVMTAFCRREDFGFEINDGFVRITAKPAK